ncbi:hypothetical protein DDZ18_13080 [Marinicauda salina]|uniref:TIGR02302 family protein n=1 Tax=Marinicauda salina TaxID=2135793 RepID=A0A2U2BQS0_9PROT|nr:DUF4175 family protein [Marinicauda salina]PWE16351.1 hypothetical protein DDZ18_13080 [Marinicauda salina]
MRTTPLILARAALVWERAAPVLAGPLAVIGVYAGLALFGVFERLGDPARALTALALAAIGGFAAVRAARRFTWPARRDAERRVEEDSRLADRPYEALRDAPSAGDDALWAAHRERMAVRLAGARTRRPKAAWAALDPWGARVALVLMLVVGGLAAGDRLNARLYDAFLPRPLAGGGAAAVADLWIEPPEYTGRPTIYLRDRRELEIPEGSVLAARVAGVRGAPRVSGAEAEIEQIGPRTYQVRAVPAEDGEIAVRAGALRERVRLALIPDEPPHLALAAEPEGDAEGRLGLEFVARDDYGVEAFALEFAPEPDAGDPADDAWERVEIAPGSVTVAGEDGLKGAEIDLARHRLAGERVLIRMTGTDAAGQTGRSAPVAITLPQRVFLDPLARAVAHERKGFLGVSDDYAPMPEAEPAPALDRPRYLDDQPDRRIERAPDEVRRLALALDAVSDAPPRFFDDPIVYMGLRTTLHEVRRAREIDALGHLDEDLWQIALRAELGSLADAEAALRAAEQALMDAMARGADAMELSALFDAFEQAMQNYMAALAREAAEEGRFAEGGGGGGMNSDALQEMLDALRESAELGDTLNARRALAALAEMLRNMQMQLARGGQGDGESEMSRALREALEELGDLIGEQRELMDETFRGEDGQSGRPQGGGEEDGEAGGGEAPRDLAGRQGALGERTGEFSESAPGGAAAEALDEARRAMREAEEALRGGDRDRALDAQDEALQALREGAGEAARRLAEARGQQGQDGETDPLGRSGSGAMGGGVDLPSESERQRARSILEELRRRAAEQNRPQDELDYIDRLLERF